MSVSVSLYVYLSASLCSLFLYLPLSLRQTASPHTLTRTSDGRKHWRQARPTHETSGTERPRATTFTCFSAAGRNRCPARSTLMPTHTNTHTYTHTKTHTIHMRTLTHASSTKTQTPGPQTLHVLHRDAATECSRLGCCLLLFVCICVRVFVCVCVRKRLR